MVGALVKLIGLDAFTVLLGRSPGNITGPFEGLLLGATIGAAVSIARRRHTSHFVRRGICIAAVAGGAVAILIILLGGHLMAGSLDLLARHFPGSRLRLDPIGSLFGERGFGRTSELATACLEWMLFAGCVAGTLLLADRAQEERTAATR